MRRIPLRTVVIVLASAATLALGGCGGAQARKAKHMSRGHEYYAQGNYEKARIEFMNALQIAPTDPDARYQNGLVDEKLGKNRDAAQFYQSVIDIDKDHLNARVSLARLLLFSGSADNALDELKPALEKHPDSAEALTVRAAARVQKQDLEGGLVDAQRAVQLEPLNEDAVGTLAGIYVAQQQPEKAAALLEDAIKRLPATVDLRLALGQVYISEKRLADAENLLLELIKLRPQDKAARIRLAQFYARQNQVDATEHTLREAIKAIPGDRELSLALVDFLANHRSPEAAEQELQKQVAAAPKDVELQFALAKFYDQRKQSEKAEAIYRQVIDAQKLEGPGLTARDHLAALYMRRGDVASARPLLAEVLTKSPRDTEALVMRGNLSLANGDPKSAIADLRAVLRDQPNAVGVLQVLARAHLANGEPAIAEETMRRAVEANSKDDGLRLDFAQLLAQLGKADQAKPIVADLVKSHPNDVPALETLFRVSASLKDYATADAAAQAIVAARPKAPLGYFFQGMLAEERKKPDDALRLFATAYDLQPGSPEPLQAQIRLLLSAKRAAEAGKRLDEVSAKYPDAPYALDMKGALLLAQGKNAESQAAYRQALERAPKYTAAYRGLANAQLSAKDADGALATLRSGEGVVDSPDQLGTEIGIYLERVGRTDEAIKEYESVLAKSPQSEIAANNLAMLIVTHRTDRQSIERAKTLVARFANSPNMSYLDTYGWVLFKSGAAAESVAVLERVVRRAPDAPVARYHLGMAQSMAGSAAEARDNLSRAVAAGSQFSGFNEAKATLDKLPPTASNATPKS